MKTLYTERLILRPLELRDLEAFNSYAKKPHIGPMAGWPPHQSMEESDYILKLMIKEKEVWGIALKDSDSLIGTIGLHQRSLEHALANKKEIGYVLDDQYWGKGLMLEAVNALIKHGFESMGLAKIVCGHRIDNKQSKRVIEKSGFTYTHEETRDDHLKQPITIRMYELKYRTYRRLTL